MEIKHTYLNYNEARNILINAGSSTAKKMNLKNIVNTDEILFLSRLMILNVIREFQEIDGELSMNSTCKMTSSHFLAICDASESLELDVEHIFSEVYRTTYEEQNSQRDTINVNFLKLLSLDKVRQVYLKMRFLYRYFPLKRGEVY